jgi:hypothetical protein
MIFTNFSDPINGWTRKMGQEINLPKNVGAILASAAFGLAIGLVFSKKPKRPLKDMDNSTITIDLHDVKKLRIERIE